MAATWEMEKTQRAGRSKLGKFDNIRHTAGFQERMSTCEKDPYGAIHRGKFNITPPPPILFISLVQKKLRFKDNCKNHKYVCTNLMETKTFL